MLKEPQKKEESLKERPLSLMQMHGAKAGLKRGSPAKGKYFRGDGAPAQC